MAGVMHFSRTASKIQILLGTVAGGGPEFQLQIPKHRFSKYWAWRGYFMNVSLKRFALLTGTILAGMFGTAAYAPDLATYTDLPAVSGPNAKVEISGGWSDLDDYRSEAPSPEFGWVAGRWVWANLQWTWIRGGWKCQDTNGWSGTSVKSSVRCWKDLKFEI